MIINLTEDLWDLLNPEFDGHTGLIGENGDCYTPSWYPLPDIRINPIMMFIPQDIGRRYKKSFIIQRREENPIIVDIGRVEKVEITENNILLYYDGKKEVVQGKNITNLTDYKMRK